MTRKSKKPEEPSDIDIPVKKELHPDEMYINWPHRDRNPIQMKGNNRYPTEGLFIEKATNPDTAMYTLDPEGKIVDGKFYPSAYLIYIYSDDEYDALRKLVGTVKHWDILKNTWWFPTILEEWQREQAMIQKQQMKQALMRTALLGEGGAVSAARTILQMIEGSLGAKGRPGKKGETSKDEGDVGKDAERMRAVAGSS